MMWINWNNSFTLTENAQVSILRASNKNLEAQFA